MTQLLRVLLVTDGENDERLVDAELRRAGYEPVLIRVPKAADMRTALAGGEWDLVIADMLAQELSPPHGLPAFRELQLDVPLIILSSTSGEDEPVDALLAGASHFVRKSRLERLAPAVQRVIQETGQRRAARVAADDAKRTEDERVQSEKMEGFGRLAGGIAHDFNNILTSILATADLGLGTPDLPQELRKDLESIRLAGKQAAATVRQLLLFSRTQVVQPIPLEINEVVQGLEPLLRRLLPASVTLQIDRHAKGIVEADPVQIEQLVVNLVTNAAHATRGQGMVTLTTSDLETTKPTVDKGRVLLPGKYVVIRVQDTGTGMDEETKARIFEPYFATSGDRLALATVYGIAENAGGHVFVNSRPGQGSLFEVCLPHVDAKAAPQSSATQKVVMGGGEVVLVIESDAKVRAPICRALRQLGYYVLDAQSGDAALTALQDYHAPVHLVITEFSAPSVDGSDALGVIQSLFPKLKIIFVSGQDSEGSHPPKGLPAGARFIAKPYTAKRLAATVRMLLDEVEYVSRGSTAYRRSTLRQG